MDNNAFKRERVHEIAADRRHGAAQLARRALQTLADYSSIYNADNREMFTVELFDLAQQLQQARPSMAPLEALLEEWCLGLRASTADDMEMLEADAINSAHDLIKKSQLATQAIAEHMVNMIEPGTTIITHSLSSTLVELFRLLPDKNIRVVMTESRPGYEGHLVAEVLADLNIPTEFITDAQLGLFTATADMALVGADTVLADGTLVNKAGTYLLALAAQDHQIPFYVCAESYKNTIRTVEELELEEMDVSELDAPSFSGIEPRNVYFDLTPSRLITGWVNESGLKKQPESAA